jgi:hypothetical protein
MQPAAIAGTPKQALQPSLLEEEGTREVHSNF